MPALSRLLLLLLVAFGAPSASGLNGGGASLAGPGVHLSLGRSAGEMVVTWSTPLTRAPAAASLRYSRCAPPACNPRDPPPALGNRVAADSTTLANNEAKASISVLPWRNISVHTALIADIQAEEVIFYAVSGDPDTTRVLNFTYTVPYERPGPVTFAIFGDLAIKEQDGANYTLSHVSSSTTGAATSTRCCTSATSRTTCGRTLAARATSF